MMSDMLITAIVLAALAIVCIISAAIVSVRNKGSLLDSKDKDFLDRWIIAKKKDLAARTDGMKLSLYMTLLVIAPLAIGFLAWIFSKNSLVTFSLAAVGVFVPELYVRATEQKQRQMFSERYVRAIKQLASSLRVGLTLPQAVDEICANPFLHDSVISEFEQINADIKVGISVQDAFASMADRINDKDVKDVATTVALVNEAGGNEADAIETIAKGIEKRLAFAKEIKSIFAGTSVTVIGIDVITYAIVVITLSSGGNSNFFLTSPLRVAILVALIIFMIIGSAVAFRMVKTTQGKR